LGARWLTLSSSAAPALAAVISWSRALLDNLVGARGIAVHDHLIVGKNGHASLKALKLM
jgi:DNA repair protein RadC